VSARGRREEKEEGGKRTGPLIVVELLRRGSGGGSGRSSRRSGGHRSSRLVEVKGPESAAVLGTVGAGLLAVGGGIGLSRGEDRVGGLSKKSGQ
jgi:hypothetical protein